MAKKAGRPTGTGIKDGKHLDRIADALTRDPSKSVNSIIMQLDSKEEPENLRRRLHRKWKAQGADRLAEARQRHEERIGISLKKGTARMNTTIAATPSAVARLSESLSTHVTATQSAVARLSESLSPHGTTMQSVTDSLAQQLGAVDTFAVQQAIRAFDNSSVQQAIRSFESSAVQQAIRSMEGSATQQALRSLEISIGKYPFGD